MEHSHYKSMVEGEHSPREIAKFVVVITSVVIISFFVSIWTDQISWLDWMRNFMGVFFVVFAGFKLAGYKMFVEMFPGYDIVAMQVKNYANLYPFIELALGLSYLLNFLPGVRDITTLAVMAVSTIGVFQELRRRRGIHCACLGNIIKLPLSTVSLVEDVGMGVMAILMLVLK